MLRGRGEKLHPNYEEEGSVNNHRSAHLNNSYWERLGLANKLKIKKKRTRFPSQNSCSCRSVESGLVFLPFNSSF